MVTSTTAGVALLLVASTAHAVILYRAAGTVGLIVTLPLFRTLSYSPIIGIPNRDTVYPTISRDMKLSVLSTWKSTAEFLALRRGTLIESEQTELNRSLFSHIIPLTEFNFVMTPPPHVHCIQYSRSCGYFGGGECEWLAMSLG